MATARGSALILRNFWNTATASLTSRSTAPFDTLSVNKAIPASVASKPLAWPVRVGLHHTGDHGVVSMRTTGSAFSQNGGSAMGMRLMEGMARGLSSASTIECDQRTRITVRFLLK